MIAGLNVNSVALFCLSLLSFANLISGLKSASDYKVAAELLPGIKLIKDQNAIPKMHAGHIPLNDTTGSEYEGSSYFFWKFQHHNSQSSNLIIWLNGGPGCSSMDGALVESGPFRVDSFGKLYLNDGSWHSRGDIVYVDQPVYTGFSTSDIEVKAYDKDLNQVSEHFLEFLDNYYRIFPEDRKKDLIFAGESYAGQYIPFIAKAINDRNAKQATEDQKINLKALLIGNAWIDPDMQSLSYLPFAIENGIITKDNPEFSNLLTKHETCQKRINSKKPQDEEFSYPECVDDILTLILEATKNQEKGTPSDQVCLNLYDYKLRDSYPSCGANWPKDISHVSTFFSTPGVLEALNLDSEKVPKWGECNNNVGNHLTNRQVKPSVKILPELLEAGVDVILYNGENDMVCNNKGVLDTINALTWGGQTGFSNSSQYYEWRHRSLQQKTEVPAGYVHYENNLTFISVKDASHMVPFDKPLISRGVLDIYLNNVQLAEEDNTGVDVLISTDEITFRDMEEELDDSKTGEIANGSFDDDSSYVEGGVDGEEEQEEDGEYDYYEYIKANYHSKKKVIFFSFMSVTFIILILSFIYSRQKFDENRNEVFEMQETSNSVNTSSFELTGEEDDENDDEDEDEDEDDDDEDDDDEEDEEGSDTNTEEEEEFEEETDFDIADGFDIDLENNPQPNLGKKKKGYARVSKSDSDD